MRILALIKRIIQQMLRDKRTLALLFIAPLFILTLMYFIFNDEASDPALGVVDIESDLLEELQAVDIVIKKYDQADSNHVLDEGLDGLLVQADDSFDLILKNDDPSRANSLKIKIAQAASKQIQAELVAGQKNLLDKQKALLDMVEDLVSHLPPDMVPEDLELQGLDSSKINQAKAQLNKLTDKDEMTLTYIYGDEDTTFFDVLSPLLVGFFVFFFVFLISGIGLLKERTSGTLERVMSTPIRRWEIVLAYLIGFGIFAIVQTIIVVVFSITVLDMVLIGSIWNVILINLLLALVALSLGTLLSTFAASEFQMVQFIPIVIVPQVFFSGIFPLDQMADWLKNLGYIMPIYYGAEALKNVMYKGFTLMDVKIDLLILSAFALVFIVLNIFALKRYRKL